MAWQGTQFPTSTAVTSITAMELFNEMPGRVNEAARECACAGIANLSGLKPMACLTTVCFTDQLYYALSEIRRKQKALYHLQVIKHPHGDIGGFNSFAV